MLLLHFPCVCVCVSVCICVSVCVLCVGICVSMCLCIKWIVGVCRFVFVCCTHAHTSRTTAAISLCWWYGICWCLCFDMGVLLLSAATTLIVGGDGCCCLLHPPHFGRLVFGSFFASFNLGMNGSTAKQDHEACALCTRGRCVCVSLCPPHAGGVRLNVPCKNTRGASTPSFLFTVRRLTYDKSLACG